MSNPATNVLRQHLPQRIDNRRLLRFEALEERQDALPRILHTDHLGGWNRHGCWVPAGLAEAHRQAGGRALHARHGLDRIGDGRPEGVEVVGLELHDDVVRPGHGVDCEHGRARVGQCGGGGRANCLGAPDVSLDENVPSNHALLLGWKGPAMIRGGSGRCQEPP